MARQHRTVDLQTGRSTPPVVALESILELVARCGRGLLNDYFQADAAKARRRNAGRRALTLTEQRAARVKWLEEDATAKRLAAAQLSHSVTQVKLGRSRIRTLSSVQLREVARQREVAAIRLRKLSVSDLAIVQKALDTFILREGGRQALAMLAAVDLFIVWLKKSSFRCGYCGQSFVPLGSFRGGRPRSWCSDAHKMAARRAHSNAG